MAESEGNKLKTENNKNIIHLLKKGIDDAYARKLDLGSESIYCFDCQKVFVSKEDHPDSLGHKTFLRYDYYNYNENIFAPTQEQIISYIENIPRYKEDAIEGINRESEKLQKALKVLKEEKIEEIKNHFDIITQNLRELLKKYAEAKMIVENYYRDEEFFYGIHDGNMDRENSIFLMTYEQIEGYKAQVARINKEITDSENLAKNYRTRIVQELDENYKKIKEILGLKISLDEYEDYFKASNDRTNKYLNHNELFGKEIRNVNEKYKNIIQVKEAINTYDVKIKIGIDYLFSQDFFVLGENPDTVSPKPRKFVKANAENNMNNLLNSNKKEKPKGEGSSAFKPHNSNYTTSYKKIVDSYQKTNTSTKQHIGKTNLIVMVDPKWISIDPNQISLANPILQRYFSYSFYSFYNKNFTEKPEKEFTSCPKSLLIDYSRRMKLMKDYAKPIPRTNKLNIFDPDNNKLRQVEVELKGEVHGYNVFPEGCRSILINGELFITGGRDEIGNNLAYVNSIDLNKGVITARPPMPNSHAYHTVEFLHNYDAFVIIGGKDGNKNSEIYDICADKWHKLPRLNLARYNCNVVYNGFTGEIYVLFGMLDDGRNSDIVEVLDLKAINGGWCKADYEKKTVVDLQVNYCKVAQFDSEKLLIYGAKELRDNKKKYAFYDSERNEITKVVNEDDKKEISKMEKEENDRDLGSPKTSCKSLRFLSSARNTGKKSKTISKAASARNIASEERVRKMENLGSNSAFK